MQKLSLSSGLPLTIFETIDSTSLEAKRRIGAGSAHHGWIMARRQTDGYGRRGRAWSQQTGNLAATLMLPLSGGLQRNPAAAGFAASLAIADALQKAGVAHRNILLKWPNDVLLSGGKVSGILLEREVGPDGTFLALGLGVNLVWKPELPDYPTACLIDMVEDAPAAEKFLDVLDIALGHRLQQLEEAGFAALREAWLERASNLGEQITVRLPAETLHGTFEGLDESGTLLLRQGEVIRRIATGDVFFPAACASNAR